MKKENLKSTLVASASFLILLDRPIQYIFECLISVTLPTNRLVVIIALVIFSLDKKINLSKRDISFLILTISSFIIGTIILPEYKTSDVIAAIGVIFPFYIGNKLVELDNNKVGKTFLAVNALIFFILFLVVTGLGGNIFELKYQLHMIGLILEKRPEIFTDQNFQILYLLSPPLILLFSKSNKYKLVVAITMLLYLYSLNFVQSRTGFIFYVLFILSIIFIMKEKNKL
ncbi:MAG: hypothetical protein VYE47_07195, partial [Pseudomonadota bacterium]|nr:hypothetical protein [Pseudomonadota bacterium]